MTAAWTIGNTGLTDILVQIDGDPNGSRRTVPIAVGLGHRLDLPVWSVARRDGRTTLTEASRLTASDDERPSSGDRHPDRFRCDSSLLVHGVVARRRVARNVRRNPLPLDGCPAAEVMIGPAAGDTTHISWEQLVVPIDGSAEADALVPVAASWATAYAFELALVAVVVPEPAPLRDDRASLRHQFLADPAAHLHHLVDTFDIANTRPLLEVITDRLSTSAGVAEHLRGDQSAVLLVPAKHRRTHWIRDGGSLAAFVRRSPVPVLSVPSTTSGS